MSQKKVDIIAPGGRESYARSWGGVNLTKEGRRLDHLERGGFSWV